MNAPMEPATTAAPLHASIGRVPDNKITNSQTSYFSKVWSAAFPSPPCRISRQQDGAARNEFFSMPLVRKCAL
jgi:hypothetical protein